MFLDYGSGSQPREGYLTSDFTGSPIYDYVIKDYRVVDAEDHVFEKVYCRNVIHHIPKEDLSLLFGEFKRILKPGGCLIISEPREEFHKQNLILDIIWYRFLRRDMSIRLPVEYVDYRDYMVGFDCVSVETEFSNEIRTFRMVD